MVEEGQPAPDFELRSDTGESVRLSTFKGSPVVLYFYPKDDTPGCTAQACGIRDEFDTFRDRGAVVLGVSPDSESSHRRFREKYGLPFTLLADPEHEVAERYGVWVEKERNGKSSSLLTARLLGSCAASTRRRTRRTSSLRCRTNLGGLLLLFLQRAREVALAAADPDV